LFQKIKGKKSALDNVGQTYYTHIEMEHKMNRSSAMTNPTFTPVEGTFKRYLFVGDIHGCLSELKTLLSIVGFGEDDALIAVGDLLDRGPDSWDVAAFIREQPNVFSVYGNHERRILRAIRDLESPTHNQRATLARLPRREWPEWAQWLDKLPAVIETPYAIACHARLDPGLELANQDREYCSGAGARIERDQADVPTWYEAWKRRHPAETRPIVIGHRKHARIVLDDGHLYALDTNAVYGGSLSALVMPAGEIVSVPSSARPSMRENKRPSSQI
jgi:serine/threonine protein phosphatase 1